MKKMLACLLMVVFALSGVVSASAAQYEKEFVFIMDISFTMRGEKVELMKENVKRAIDVIFGEDANSRIALVAYSVHEYLVSDFQTASGAEAMKRKIDDLEVLYNTNMTKPLSLAATKLRGSRANHKVAVFFGDGVHSKEIDHIDNIRKAAADLKSVADVYSVGIFQDINAYEAAEAEELMSFIATDPMKCYYTASSDQLEYAVDEILDLTVFDKYRIQITTDVACEFSITHNGKTLDEYNSVTSFGRIISDGERNGKRIAWLKAGTDYAVEIMANSDEYVTYTIQYSDRRGVFTDTRVIAFIPVSRRTRMYTNTLQNMSTYLSVDFNGDGIEDNEYVVGPNGKVYASVEQRIRLADYEIGRRLSPYKVDAFASSCLKSSGAYNYDARNAVDGDIQTQWVEGVGGFGKGETITLEFDETDVTGFVIQSGTHKTDRLYWLNGRARTIKVYVEGHGPLEIRLDDVRENQVVLFEPAVTTSFITLELVDFHTSGTGGGQDTAITDMWVLHEGY